MREQAYMLKFVVTVGLCERFCYPYTHIVGLIGDHPVSEIGGFVPEIPRLLHP